MEKLLAVRQGGGQSIVENNNLSVFDSFCVIIHVYLYHYHRYVYSHYHVPFLTSVIYLAKVHTSTRTKLFRPRRYQDRHHCSH